MDKNPEMQGIKTPTPGTQPAAVNPGLVNTPVEAVGNSAATPSPTPTPTSTLGPTPTPTLTSSPSQATAPSPMTAPSLTPPTMPFTPVAAAPNMPNGSVVMPADQPQKKHTGLIVGIIVAALLLLVGGGVLLWYNLFYNTPEKVVFDAIDGLLHEENIALSGSAWVEVPSEDFRVDISLKNAANQTSGMSDLSIKLGEMQDEYDDDYEDPIEIDAGVIGLSDGKLYARFGNIMNSVDRILYAQGVAFDELDQSGQLLYQLGEIIDEQWWEISILDIIDRLTEEIDDADTLAQVENVRELYRCMTDVARQNHTSEIAKLYRENRFAVVTKVAQSVDSNKVATSGNSLYELSFDYEKLANFLNALPETEMANQVYVCANNYQAEAYSNSEYAPAEIDSTMFYQIEADDLAEILDDTMNQYYLEISNWRHQIRSIYVRSISSSTTGAVDLYFDYTPVTISAPDDVRPITDLYDEAVEIIEESLNVDLDWDLDLDLGLVYELGPVDEYGDGDGYINIGTYYFGDDITCDVYDYNDDDETFNCLLFIESEDWAEERI